MSQRKEKPKADILSQVLESTSDCIFSVDKDWRFTFLNTRAKEELLPDGELVGRHVLDAYPALADTPFWPLYREVMVTREPRDAEGFMPGLNRWYEVHAAPISDGITVFFRNIDDRKRGEEALRERATYFRRTLDHLPHMVWSTLPDGYHDYFSEPWYEFTGIVPGSTDGDAWNAMFHPDDRERAWATWRECLSTGQHYEIEYRLRHRSGEYRWVLGRAWPERDPNGEIIRWYGTCTDIHDRVCAEIALRESKTLQQSVLDHSMDCIKVLSVDGTLEFMNDPGCHAMEISLSSVEGKRWTNLWPVAGRQAAQAAVAEAAEGTAARFTGYCPTAKGKPKWWDVIISPILDDEGKVVKLLSISRDVTALREKSDELKWASEHDALTSLPNRRAFEAHLQAAILRAMRSGKMVGLLLIDLDHFKHVNDTLGHSAGDHLLEAFAERLRKGTRQGDFVARLGGDEFAVILEDVEHENDVTGGGASILDRLKTPVRFDGRVISGGASIGGAIFPRDAQCAHELLKHADTALYALKAEGRGGTKMFHNHMREEAQRVASQLNLARIAVTEKSVFPHYQPKVDLKSGKIVGLEALLRWQHPSRGLQDPESVVEAFKDYDLASRIGELMQGRVFEDIAGWRARGIEIGNVALNAAPAEFLRDDYAEKLLSRLDQFKIPPSLIEIEVTEHAFFERGSQYVARALDRMKQAGVRISLDDFGTGHSSLSHLRDFPVDVVKIDRSFVASIEEDGEIAAIVRAVVNLAESLSLDVVAEGVETAPQLKMLRSMGCRFGQGWFFGRAVQSDEIRCCFSQAA